MKQRRCNKIRGLEDDEGVCDEASKVDAIAVNYFEGLFATCTLQRITEIIYCVEARVSEEDNMKLMRPISDEETRRTCSKFQVHKSSGPDGFAGSFFHEYWEVVPMS